MALQLDQDQLRIELAVFYQQDLDLFAERHKRASALNLFAQQSRAADVYLPRIIGWGCSDLAHRSAASPPSDASRPWRRLVEHSPEYAEIADGGDKIAKFDRLDHVGIHPEFVGLLEIGLLA
ncbi:hypothetical protein Q3H58_004679 [Pseudomonas psychrotolerans]|nr:hypothetical protein [Pseudomonas psychrotolerans]